MSENMNIYEKMSAITHELDRVAKNKTVGSGANSYKAVMENDVLLAVKPLEEKYGVYSFPIDRETAFDKDYQIEKAGYKKDDPPKISFKFFVRVKTTYRFVNIEKPTEFIDMVSFGDGVDPQDKAPGKAMTYADKYALMKAYKIVTGDDPDANKSDMSYDKPQNNNHSYTNLNEKQAFAKATADGLANIIKSLEKAENVEFKPAVMQKICAKYNANKWGDLPYNKVLIADVAEELKIQKDMKEVGL